MKGSETLGLGVGEGGASSALQPDLGHGVADVVEHLLREDVVLDDKAVAVELIVLLLGQRAWGGCVRVCVSRRAVCVCVCGRTKTVCVGGRRARTCLGAREWVHLLHVFVCVCV